MLSQVILCSVTHEECPERKSFNVEKVSLKKVESFTIRALKILRILNRHVGNPDIDLFHPLGQPLD